MVFLRPYDLVYNCQISEVIGALRLIAEAVGSMQFW
jgi:hypothetical protein